MSKQGEVVCVTGGSGCIGSWLVRLLLHRDYTVYATVKDLKDEGETKHLEALVEGAESRLRQFQIDLLDYNSILAAVNGCSGVFHLASPCIIDPVHDPEKELLDPAIKGTLNVLTAAKHAGVSRVVQSSSISAITPSPSWPSDKVKGEDCWTDIDYCKQKGIVFGVWLVVVSIIENAGRESSVGICRGEEAGCGCGESRHGDGPCYLSQAQC